MRLTLVALLFAGVALPAVAQAQDSSLPARVDKLEHQMHAVQRKVFPGGNPDYFEPQIAPPVAQPAPAGNPADSALADLTGRVGALEQQLAQVTNQTEENSHKLELLQQAFDKMKGDTDYRLNALEGHAAPPAGGNPSVSPDNGPGPGPGAAEDESVGAGHDSGAMGDNAPAFGPSGRAPMPPGVQGVPGADRLSHPDAAATQAAGGDQPAPDSAPSSGDPAEDAYMAGYHLWTQKRYADAEAQLKQVVAKYPDSRRASFAQNLLGRAYMDDGQYASAAEAFLASYRKFPRGERAPDSLYYLGQVLAKLKKTSQACQAYQEFDDVYGAGANATLKAKVAQGKVDAGCGG